MRLVINKKNKSESLFEQWNNTFLSVEFTENYITWFSLFRSYASITNENNIFIEVHVSKMSTLLLKTVLIFVLHRVFSFTNCVRVYVFFQN